jgi:hypothetical protein
VTEILDKTRRDIAERLRDLQPFVEEYRRLEEAVSALAGIASPPSASPSTPRPRAPRRPHQTTTPKVETSKPKHAAKTPRATKHHAGRSAGGGPRAAQTLAIVKANPGITIPTIAAQMAIKGNYLYRILPKLEQEGKVVRRGHGWEPNGP